MCSVDSHLHGIWRDPKQSGTCSGVCPQHPACVWEPGLQAPRFPAKRKTGALQAWKPECGRSVHDVVEVD